MSEVKIRKPEQQFDFNDFLFGRWAQHARRIEKRAYQFFTERGFVHGHDLDDWLKAEREMNSGSTCEVKIGDKAVTIVLSTPGFDASDFKIDIVPTLVIVEGENERQAFDEKDETTVESQMRRAIFHQIPLPEAVDVYAATATFNDGELRIVVPLKGKEALQHKITGGKATSA